MYKNKNVFITGANGSLGRDLISNFHKKKANVVCCIKRKNINFLKFIRSKKLNKNQKIDVVVFDITKDKDHKKISKYLKKKNFKIDLLINNAAIAKGAITELTSKQNLMDVFNVNFFSQIQVIQTTLRFLKKSTNASIVNIGSVSGNLGYRGFLSYGASKAALMYSTKILANEFSNYKIRVNCIAPNVFLSKMSNLMDDQIKNDFIQNSFSNRMCKTSDIVNLINFLGSNKSSYINGQVLYLDGGNKF